MSNFKVNENVDVLPTDPSGSLSQGRNVLPEIGHIIIFAGSTAPTGWLLCNGQSTSGYPILESIVGASVPDLRDRFLVGKWGSSQTLGEVVGNINHTHSFTIDGAIAGKISTNAHNHSFTSFNTNTAGIAHNHNGNLNQSFANSLGSSPHTNFVNGSQANVITRNHIHPTSGTANLAYTSSGTHNHRHDVGASNSSGIVADIHNHASNDGSGTSSSGSNLPPTKYFNYIIKADQ
jgi:microcystin-dependent protein